MANPEKELTAGANEPHYTWDDLVAAVGQDFSDGEVIVADETISSTDVARYCEPWEIGCPIYWDEEVAKTYGYRGIVVPWSAIKQTFSHSGFWRPGDPARFTTSDPDFKAKFGRYTPQENGLPIPQTDQELVTHMKLEFFEPVVVGDRLHVKGRKLVEATPKQTSIGFGAFITLEAEVYNQLDQLVARVGEGLFRYDRGTKIQDEREL